MNIVDKMKQDWDRRAMHDARFWIATEAHASDQAFSDSGIIDCEKLLLGMAPYLDPSWHVLEIGCGIGRMLKPLAPRFAYVCGVDVSGEMIEQSRQWLCGLENVETFENSGIDLQCLGDRRFDWVFAYVAFQHMPKEVCASYLHEIHRVLKPAGLLKFQVFIGREQGYSPAFEDTVTLRIYDKAELTDLLAQAGFAILDQTQLNEHNLNGLICSNSFVLAQAQAKAPGLAPDVQTDLNKRHVIDKTSPTDIKMSMVLAKRHIQNNHHDTAQDILEGIIQRSPEQTDARLLLADLYAFKQRWDDAIAMTRDLVRTQPTCYQAYILLTRIYLATGQRPKAEQLLADLKARHHSLAACCEQITTLLNP